MSGEGVTACEGKKSQGYCAREFGEGGGRLKRKKRARSRTTLNTDTNVLSK